jgi:hypothetical protein
MGITKIKQRPLLGNDREIRDNITAKGSVAIVRSRTKTTELLVSYYSQSQSYIMTDSQ